MNTVPLLALARLDSAPASAATMAERWVPLFSDSERRRLERFTRPQRRHQFVAAHALLRLAAASFDSTASSAPLRCEVDADGRPRIEAPPGWQVSLSHSGAYVAALLDRGARSVGVDVEWMRPGRDILAIVRAACGVDAGSRDLAYRIWATHEARLKAAHGVAPAGEPCSAWQAQVDGHALAVAGVGQAPADVGLFAWTDGGSAERSTCRVEWTAS